MVEHRFSGLIKCLSCGKNYKKKHERKQLAYICSGFANYGKDFCTYNPVFEEDLLMTISRHFAVQGNQLIGDVREVIEKIEVKQGGYIIYYKDGSKSIIDNSSDYGVKVKF
jgi:hypothetical protein